MSLKKYLHPKWLLLFVILIFRTTYPAEVLNLDIQSCIRLAFEENHEIRSIEFSLKKSKWDRRYAYTLLFPRFSFTTRYSHIDDRTYAERDFRRYLPPELRSQMPQTVFQETYSSSIEANLSLFNGSLVNGLVLSNTGVRLSKKMERSTRDNIVFQVVAAYLNILKSEEMLEVQKEYLKISETNLDKALKMVQAGRYSKAEMLRWKVELQQQKSNVANTEALLRNSYVQMQKLLSLENNFVLEVAHEIPKEIQQIADEFLKMEDSVIVSMAQLNNEELIQVNSALNAAKENSNINLWLYRNSYNSYLPTVNLTYNYSWRDNNTIELDDYSPKTLMINLNFPLFTSFQNTTKLISSYYDYKQNEELFYNQVNDTRVLLINLVNRIINLKSLYQLSETAVEINQLNYQVAREHKDKGLLSNTDFVEAKLNFQQSTLDLTGQYYDLISAVAQLYYLLGKMEQVIPY